MNVVDKACEAIEAVAAARDNHAEGSNEYLFEAAEVALEQVCSLPPQTFASAVLDRRLSGSDSLSRALFAVLEAHAQRAPSYEPDESWVKVIGLVFTFQGPQDVAPYFILSPSEVDRLTQVMNVGAAARCEELGLPSEGLKVTLGGLAGVFPQGNYDMLDIGAMQMLERSIGKHNDSEYQLPTFEHEGVTRAVLAATISVPIAEHGFASWKDFDENLAIEVEDRVFEDLVELGHFGLSIPGLTAQPGDIELVDCLGATTGFALFGDDLDVIDEAILRLEGKKVKDPVVEFVLSDAFDGPVMHGGTLRMTDLSMRLKDGTKLLGEIAICQSLYTGFLLGFLQWHIQRHLNEVAVSIKDLREAVHA